MKKRYYAAALLGTALIMTSCGTNENTSEIKDSAAETEAVTVSETVSVTECVTEPQESAVTTTAETAETAAVSAENSSSVTSAVSEAVTNASAAPSGNSSSENQSSQNNNENADSKPVEEPTPDNGDVTISLNGSSADCSSSRVSVNGSEITITAEGTYKVSGSLSGMIIVAAPKDAKVDIELNNAEISNPNGPAIRIDTADKVKVISAGGTSNFLSDGGSSEACIFSKEDLTLKGDGTMKIHGNVKNAVYSKNTLKITGGSFDIFSQNNGLVGKDKVVIEAGEITINCSRDGIKATNENESGKGTVTVTGGNIWIESGDDAIQAISGVTVNNCSISAKVQGKKVNCNTDVAVDEGCITKIKE